MNTDTGEIRELAEGEKPKPEEILLETDLQFRIGRGCFKIIAVDPKSNRIIAEGIPRRDMKDRHQRRRDAVELQRQMRSGQKLKSIEIPI